MPPVHRQQLQVYLDVFVHFKKKKKRKKEERKEKKRKEKHTHARPRMNIRLSYFGLETKEGASYSLKSLLGEALHH